jgi:hypothetical protein
MMWEIIPNPGRIRMYTSGCPKNQNRCWYRIGSPPPDGSKNDVLKFRSVRSIVMAPANTGKARSRRIVVIRIDHENSGILSIDSVLVFMLMIVVMKLIAPRMEDTPARCSLKIAESILGELWNVIFANGG